MYGKGMKLLVLLLTAAVLLGAPVSAAESETETLIIIEKVLATSTKEPFAMLKPSDIPFTTSTTGASISSVAWMDQSGATLAPGDAFKNEVYTLTVTLTANPGYVFSQSVLGYLYNKSANVSVSMDGKSVSLRRNMQAMVSKPNVIKSPLTDPAVDPGELVSYVATATFATRSEWFFVSPDGSETLNVKQMLERFSGISIDNAGIGRIIVYHVPAEMNGWQIYCRFWESTDVYSSDTNKATIQVKVPAETPAPTPEPTPAPTPEPTPEPSAASVPETTPEAAEPTPTFPDEDFSWKHNESSHWLESESGVVREVGEHRFVWTSEGDKGEERGVCADCGYTITRVNEVSARQDAAGKILIGLGAAVGVMMMLSLAAPKKRKPKH